MNSSTPFGVAIIGGGCSGVLTAVQLARQSTGSPLLRVALIESGPKLGRGVAYQTNCPRHLLNVPASGMSALPEQPLDFLNWAQQRFPGVTADDFLPRGAYGEYLHDTLNSHAGNLDLTVVYRRVIDVVPGDRAARIQLSDNSSIHAARVVLAGYNGEPLDPPLATTDLLSSPRYIRNPWRADWLDNVAIDDPVILLGCGLTAVDVVLELIEQGHQGEIHLVSRRGLLPQSHVPAGQTYPLAQPLDFGNSTPSARAYLRVFRLALQTAQANGHDWRDVVAAVRSITQQLWMRLSPPERARFLRHVRPYWDTHRHRIAPQVAAALDAPRINGRLHVHAAPRVTFEVTRDAIAVDARERGTGRPLNLYGRWVINCTGPSSDIRRSHESLWRSLLRRGLIQADELGLGVLTSEHGAVLDAVGHPSEQLYVVGPLRKAQLWENVAVPELRVQAAQMAGAILREAGRQTLGPTIPAATQSSIVPGAAGCPVSTEPSAAPSA